MSAYHLIALIAYKLLVLSSLSLLIQLCIRRFSAALRNAVALASVVMALALPIAVFLPVHRAISTPMPVAISEEYVVVPQILASEIAGSSNPTIQESVVDSNHVRSAVEITNYFCIVLVAIYLLVLAILLLRLVYGYFRVTKIRSRATPLQDNVLLSADAHVPMAAWLGKPFILLPTDAMSWPDDRLQRVLAHERAHLQRGDLIWNFISQLACAIYWPMPTLWILNRIVRDTSELACDDRVLGGGASASEYAQDLVEIARDLSKRFPVPSLPIATKSDLGKRIAHILSQRARRRKLSAFARLVTIFVTLACGLTVAAYNVSGPRQSGVTQSDIQAKNFAANQTWGLATPGSVAGSPDNSFVGTMADGRKVELLQVQHVGENGFEAWSPDGTRIAHPAVYGKHWWLSQSDHIELVFKIQTTNRDDDFEATTQEGPSFMDENNAREYKGGTAFPADGSGWRIGLGEPALSTPGTSRNSFSLTTGTNKYAPLTDLQIDPNGSVISIKPRSPLAHQYVVSNAKINLDDSETRPKMDEHGTVLDKTGRVVMQVVRGWSLEFDIKGCSPNEAMVSVETRQARAITPLISFPGYRGPNRLNGLHVKALVEEPLSNVHHVTVERRDGQAVDFLHVVVRPDLLGKS